MSIKMKNGTIKHKNKIIGYYNKYDQDLIKKFNKGSVILFSYEGVFDFILVSSDKSICMSFNSNDTWEIYEYNEKDQENSHLPEELLAKGKIDYDYLYEKMVDIAKPSRMKIVA